ncbi:ABC transporter substrate-binding protein [Vulcanimicrobium alpinum]|uniref:ABC transporter substrate-binding protein n=1 Tax=Vulcanimicrobium alpinum TaxID=3016050 RepID=A0AAN2CBQ6_UNVUL|nr:ABC transporter substrate-binding protein [Vulcanimicrobium alpinum]BDE08112.1 ABC transporter substrate-binding protein [Vulcanimicrobium alpinum]
MHKIARASLAALLVLLLGGGAARAAEPVKIGMITTLSTAGGYLGEDVRDGFQLAIDEEHGKLGGVPVQLLVEDDGLKPASGKQIADKYRLQDKVQIFTGIIYSNVALAVVPSLVEDGAFYLSPNAGPSQLAGKGCNKNYFVVSWQNDTPHEATGAYADYLHIPKMVVVAPNYPAGKDAIAGFKRFYHGEIAGEYYTALDQTDYSAEIAKIRDAKADGIFYFLPGGLGINFIKQFTQAGLRKSMKVVLPEFSLESHVVSAIGDDALGLYGTGHWLADLPYPANVAFVKAYTAKYHRDPTPYASQGYDTAKLLAGALRAVGGDVSKADAFRDALRKADFKSTRGAFKFGPNQHPIQDWYSARVVRGKNGKLVIRGFGKILRDTGDVYASQCKL